MKTKLLLCLAWGLFWTYCLLVPYGLFAAWFSFAIWENRWPSLWNLTYGTLAIPLYVLVTNWYLTIPLAVAIGWCLYWRKQLKAKSTSKP
jgi:hypothetical protein